MPTPDLPRRPRVFGAVALGVLVAALAAQILGEYEFSGVFALVAGPAAGLVIAEVVLRVGRWRDTSIAVFCGAAAALSIMWAGRIDANAGVESVKAMVWVAAALAAATGFARVEAEWIRGRFRR